MNQCVNEQMATRKRAEELAIDHMCDPRQWMPVRLVKSGKRPGESPERNTAIHHWVLLDIRKVIDSDEAMPYQLRIDPKRYDRQTEQDKSYYYLEMEPLFAQGKIQILDHPELARELRLLERRPRPGGKTIIDHPRGSHDDFANSLAIAAAKALKTNVSFGYPIGVGHGIGWEIRKALGSSLGD